MKQYLCASMLIGLSSLLSLTVLAADSLAVDSLAADNLANPMVESVESAAKSAANAKEQSDDNLRQGIPGRRLGGGTRSDTVFSNTYSALVALTEPDALSVTTALQPKLLFYVPEMTTANTAEFVLFNHSNELVYETTFEVAPTGGLVSVEIPADTPPLTLGENYQWYFSIIPEANDRAHDIVVYGSIRRVEATAWLDQQQIDISKLDQLTPLAKARVLYQQADLWLDAAVMLDQMRRQNPDDVAIAAEWTHLLESAGLTPMLQPSSADASFF